MSKASYGTIWSVTLYIYMASCISLIHSIPKQIICKTVYMPVIHNLRYVVSVHVVSYAYIPIAFYVTPMSPSYVVPYPAYLVS